MPRLRPEPMAGASRVKGARWRVSSSHTGPTSSDGSPGNSGTHYATDTDMWWMLALQALTVAMSITAMILVRRADRQTRQTIAAYTRILDAAEKLAERLAAQ